VRKRNGAGHEEYAEEVRGVFSVRLYDARSCRAILRRAGASDDWGAAEVSVEEDEGYGSSVEEETRRASALTPARDSPIVREFDRRMNRVVKPLVRRLWGVGLRRHTGTHLVRYTRGNFYAPHTDAALDVSDRYFTVLCYLNDDFEGGQTSFPLLGHSVEPRTGKAVIFPATYLHSSEPVLSGEKYVLVTWLMGPEPPAWI
jgi:predicted 2-oxoglutarate/Fe(II)-dependent dioxygenase YbiX